MDSMSIDHPSEDGLTVPRREVDVLSFCSVIERGQERMNESPEYEVRKGKQLS